MYSLDPDFLRTFIAISETGSFSAAGEKVNKTQSTVSAQVKRLEEILNVDLFKREGRRNVLTSDGNKLLEYASSMVRLNDAALHQFRPPEVQGTVRIGAIDEYAQAFLPQALRSFARSHPAVLVEVATGTTGTLLPRLEAGSLDAVVISCRAGEDDIEVLRTDQLHWIGAEGSCLHFESPVPLSAWSDGCSWRDMATAALASEGRAWRIAFTTSNAGLLSTTIRDGLGIGVAPSWFLGPGLAVIDELDQRCPLGIAEIGVKCRPGVNDPALEVFLTHMRAELNSPALAA